jgi:hypothetical protein
MNEQDNILAAEYFDRLFRLCCFEVCYEVFKDIYTRKRTYDRILWKDIWDTYFIASPEGNNITATDCIILLMSKNISEWSRSTTASISEGRADAGYDFQLEMLGKRKEEQQEPQAPAQLQPAQLQPAQLQLAQSEVPFFEANHSEEDKFALSE